MMDVGCKFGDVINPNSRLLWRECKPDPVPILLGSLASGRDGVLKPTQSVSAVLAPTFTLQDLIFSCFRLSRRA